MNKTRIYLIHHTIERGGTPTEERRLIEATNQAQAIGAVVKSSITCAIATSQDLIDLTKLGVEVEKA